MKDYITIGNTILLGVEFVSAFIAVLYYKKVKGTNWEIVVYFLSFIFLQELYFKFNPNIYTLGNKDYYLYFGMPVQFLFYYWLFAFNSLNNKKLFYFISSTLLISILIEFLFKGKVVFLSYTVGTILLCFLVVLEFIKQIKSDEILNFKANRMFYIMIGVILSFIGTYPFYAFNNELRANYNAIWKAYYLYFIGSSITLYLLFAASFIWGKRQS